MATVVKGSEHEISASIKPQILGIQVKSPQILVDFKAKDS
jgi:hypothetical protein